MKQFAGLALGVVAGIAIGAAGTHGLRAQGNERPAYVIAEVEVTDQAGFQEYSKQVPETLAPYNARYLVRGGKVAAKEGAPPAGRVVVIGFDNMAQAEKWHDTPPYSELAPLRQKTAKSRVFIVEGEPH